MEEIPELIRETPKEIRWSIRMISKIWLLWILKLKGMIGSRKVDSTLHKL